MVSQRGILPTRVDTFHFGLGMDENNEHVPLGSWDVCFHDEVVALHGRVM